MTAILEAERPEAAARWGPVAVLRLFSPCAFFTYTANGGRPDTWRGSPWFFIGWQLALCAIAVLVAALCGADGRALRARTGEPGPVAGTAVVLLVMVPGLVPWVARWIRTFPPAGGDGPSSSPLWVTVLGVCVAAIAATLAGTKAPVWYLRFIGADVIINGLGFGVFTIPAIVSVSRGYGILNTFGNPTYGDGPFEQAGIHTTVPLLAAFLAACVVQVIGGVLLLRRPRPLGIAVSLAGMLFSAPFWWGFDLPLAWFNASGGLTLLILAWAGRRGT